MLIAFLDIFNDFNMFAREKLQRFLKKHKPYATAIAVEYCVNHSDFLRAVWNINYITDIVSDVLGEDIDFKYSYSFGEDIGDNEMKIVIQIFD